MCHQYSLSNMEGSELVPLAFNCFNLPRLRYFRYHFNSCSHFRNELRVLTCWDYQADPRSMYTTTANCCKEAGGDCRLADARLDHGRWYTVCLNGEGMDMDEDHFTYCCGVPIT